MRRVIVALAALGALILVSCRAAGPDVGAVDTGRDNAIGPANAAVTVEEWGDFQCPACRNFAALQQPLAQTVLADRSSRFVFSHMAFLGPESILAAESAECAGDQGRFWDYHDALYAAQNGENHGAFSADHLKHFAATIGLDQGTFATCLDTHKYLHRIVLETQRGTTLGVTSTPTLLVNGQRVTFSTGRDPVESIRVAIQNAKSR